MAVREKAGMWCPHCRRPVAARRTGHATRNTLGAALTAGLALKSERWHCPHCGGQVEREAFRKIATPPAESAADAPAGTVAVTLEHPGHHLVPVLRVYRRATGASLRAAKAAMEDVPVVVGRFRPVAAERLVEELRSAGAIADVGEPPSAVPDGAPNSVACELAKLARLRESGALSAAEFAAAKAQVLG